MEDLASLGFTVDSGGLKAGRTELEKFGKEAAKTEKAVDKFGNELTKADKDAGRFIDSTGKMREANGRFVKGLEKTSETVRKTSSDFSALDTTAVAAAGSLGALATASGAYTIALANSVKEQQAWADATGVSLQVLQGWGAAARTVGRDVGYIGDVFKDTSEKIGDFVATGGGEAADVFEQLGISAKELQNLSPDQQLLRIADSLDQVQTRGEKLFILESLANDASLLLPLLEDNASGLREVTDQAERLGVVISAADAAKLREVASEWNTVTQAVEGLGNTIATAYAGDAADALNVVSSGVQDLTEFVRENADTLQTVVTVLASGAAGYLTYTAAIKAGTVAMAAFNAVTSANPIGLLVRGLAVAGGAYAAYIATKEDATAIERDNTNAIYGNIDAVAAQSKEVRESAIATLELRREQIESDLEQRKVEAASFQQRIAELAALRDQYGMTAENVELYNKSITNLALTQENSAEIQAQLESQLAETDARIAALRDTFTTTTPVIRSSSDALDDYAKLHDSLTGVLAGSNKPMVEYQKTLDAINALEVNAAKKVQLRQMAERKLNIELAKQAKSQRDLAGQLDVTTAAYNSYYDIVQQIVDSGADQETQAALLSKAYQVLGQDLADIAEEAEKAKDKADPYADAWEEATKRIDDSFAKAWEGAFDSFESFADSIMGSFKTLLANLAHQAISKPILISMGIGGGLGGAGTAAASTGAAGGFSFSDIGSVFSGNGLGSMISDFGGWVGGSSSLAGTGAGNFISGATANAANISNLAWGAGGIGGGLLSNALGLSGQYSGITGAAGTAIGGTLLAPVLGPLAPLAGSFLGSALGGLFGNDEPSNMEGRAIIDNLADPSLRISGQTGDKFSQENRDAAANIAGIIQQNILGTISGLSGQEFGGELIVGMGQRDPFRFRYTDEAGQSFGLGRSGSQGLSFDERIGANTRDVNEYLETITQFFSGQADLDLSVYEQFQRENELLIEAVSRVSAQLNTMTGAADLLGLTFDGTEEQMMQWSNTIAQAAGGVEQLQASTASYYQNFYTEAERFDAFASGLSDTFAELGVELPTTRDGFRDIIDSLDLTTQAGQEMYATLLNLNPQVAQYISGLEQVGSTIDQLLGRADNALSGVMSAINAERDAVTDRYNEERNQILSAQSARQAQLDAERDAFRELEKSYSALDRAFVRMQMTDSASVFSRASGATEYLRAALASGGIPSAEELEPYLAAAQEPTEALFSSFEDYARQFFVAKNLISELRERAGDQLTTEEKAIRNAERFYDSQLSALERQYELDMKAIDAQAEEAQSLYDAVMGTNDGIQSIVEAINGLHGALADVVKQQLGSGGTFGTLPGGETSVAYEDDPLTQAYREALGRDPDLAGYKWYTEQIQSGNKTLDQALAEIAASDEASRNVPAFANGGSHMGGMRMVGERGAEMEFTGPSRVVSNGDIMTALSTGSNTATAIKSLEQNMMAAMRKLEKNTRDILQLERRWDQQGLPETRDLTALEVAPA